MLSKKKKKCPRCDRTLTLKCFIYNVVKKEKLCRTCHKSVGTNPFYDPKIKGAKSRSRGVNYNIKFDESQVLYKKFIKQGLSSEQAMKKVKGDKKYVNQFYYNKRNEKKDQEKTKQEQKKKFIEGLK